MKQTDPELERKVLEVVKEGGSLREASRMTGVPLTTVRAIVQRYLEAEEEDASAQGSSTSENGGAEEVQNVDPLTRPTYSSRKEDPLSPVSNLRLTPEARQALLSLERENAILKVRNESLLGRVSQLEASTSAGGVAADSVAGRPSLADFRERTWRRFAGAVMRLPEYVEEHGLEDTEEMVAATLIADLHTLALGPPPTSRIARMRNELSHFLNDPAKIAVLLGRDYAGRKMREWMLKWCADAFYRPSVAKLFDKSAETYMPPGMWGEQ